MTDRKPPQALDLEEAVLGAMMLERDGVEIVMNILTEECFYKEKHGRIFNAIMKIWQRKEPVDILTVTMQLKSTNELEVVGGAYYISQLTNRVASAANIEFHARIILQEYLKRTILKYNGKLEHMAYSDTCDVFDLRDTVQELSSLLINETTKGKQVVSVAEVVKLEREEYYKKVEAYKLGLPNGVNTGFKALNKQFGGWQKANMIVLAARPGMGKTSLVLAFAKNSNEPVLFFSLEMSAIELTKRLIQMEAQVDPMRYKNGNLREDELRKVEHARGVIERLNLQIEDKPGIDWQELRSKSMKAVQGGVSLIIVDYLQLVNVVNKKGRNREAEISEVARELKNIAKACDVPVIALSQMSRAVEQRGGEKRPQLSDLRESGEIEQAADIVMFIHRPEYYGIMDDEAGDSTQGVAEIIIAKNRNGAVGDVRLKWIAESTLFTDFDATYTPNTLQPNTDFIPKTNDLPF